MRKVHFLYLNCANVVDFSKKAFWALKQAFFEMQTSLVCGVNKACLKAMQQVLDFQSVVIALMAVSKLTSHLSDFFFILSTTRAFWPTFPLRYIESV
jgi:hypothetical protein